MPLISLMRVSKLPLQQGHLGVLGGFFDVQRRIDAGLLRGDAGDASDRSCGVDAHAVTLDDVQHLQRALG